MKKPKKNTHKKEAVHVDVRVVNGKFANANQKDTLNAVNQKKRNILSVVNQPPLF